MSRTFAVFRRSSIRATIGLSFQALLASSVALAAVPRVAGKDVVSGKPVEVSASRAARGTVVAFVSARCPCSASHEAVLKELYGEFSSKGFQFIAVHSNGNESEAETRAHFTQAGLPFPVLEDRTQEAANTFKALKTPHVYVLDPSGAIEYQGGVDDSSNASSAKKHYLKEVLVALADGKPAPFKETRALGCVIQR